MFRRAGQLGHGRRQRHSTLWAIAMVAVGATAASTVEGAPPCPTPQDREGITVFEFEDGSFALRSTLEVNVDGAAAAYLPGDHGFTYVANGVALWERGQRVSCTPRGEECRRRFLNAAKKDFRRGTDEFCAFGIEVAPPKGRSTTRCTNGVVIGNGKGLPARGAEIETVLGDRVRPYVSTTSVRHQIGGVPAYLDAATIPATVVPRDRVTDLGTVVWVRNPSNGRAAFAIAGDVGPAYGEGSIALHQLLRYGESRAQKPGPIPAERRCGAEERSLEPPFTSSPDLEGDDCGKGGKVRRGTDIRAKAGLGEVELYYLGRAKFRLEDRVVQEEVSIASLTAKASEAGYATEHLNAMARCVSESGPGK